MREAIKFILIGYLSGSILFARICAKLLNKPGILYESKANVSCLTKVNLPCVDWPFYFVLSKTVG